MNFGNNDTRAQSGRAQALVELYERAAYLRVEPPVLQPAEPFLELSGEELRRRMFLTADADGRELCLRPDLTIPTCRLHIQNGAPVPASYCYLGRIFRDRGGGGGEYLQAGIESLGRDDLEAADAECLALALDSARAFGVEKPNIRMGDVGLFSDFVAALDLSPAWRRRLLKDFNRTGTLATDLTNLKQAASAPSPHAGMLAALEGSDPASARAFVADLLKIAGITNVGGRTLGEIAERFLEQASLGSADGICMQSGGAIERYLAIEGEPDAALAELRALAKDSNLNLAPALDRLEQRIGFMAAGGVDLKSVRFSTAFGRALDYYSGMVFELYDPRDYIKWPLIAGGRYDRLMTLLGSKDAVPAVGFAAWIAELEEAGAA